MLRLGGLKYIFITSLYTIIWGEGEPWERGLLNPHSQTSTHFFLFLFSSCFLVSSNADEAMSFEINTTKSFNQCERLDYKFGVMKVAAQCRTKFYKDVTDCQENLSGKYYQRNNEFISKSRQTVASFGLTFGLKKVLTTYKMYN